MKPELPVLIKARAKIADPAHWGKGIRTLSGGHRGLDTCCAADAINDVAPSTTETALRRKAYCALSDAIGEPSIVKWNDAPERTHAQVLAAFDKAIASAS